MLVSERRKHIVELLEQNSSVSVPQLSERFEVSEMTVRRDLRALEKEGVLKRVHGGAVNNRGRGYEPPFRLRVGEQAAAKQAIGRAAAELVLDGHSIALDVGTTTLEVARALNSKHNLTIVTSSLPIANEITSAFSLTTDVRLILAGGVVRAGELSLIGNIAERTYRELFVDIAFLGVGGISTTDGLTEYNLEDARVKQSLLQSAQQIVVVADSSKFERTTFALIAPLSVADIIITDSGISEEVADAIRSHGVKLVIAE